MVISIGVLAHLIFLLLTNEQNIFDYLSKISLPYLLLIILCLLCNWLGHALRLMIWTHYIGHPFAFRDTLRIAVYTELGAAVTPTLIGGGPIKMALMIKNKLSTGKAGFLTLLNGVEDFIMYCTVLVIGLFYARQSIMKILNSIVNALQENAMKILIVAAVIITLSYVWCKLGMYDKFHFLPDKLRRSIRHLLLELKAAWYEVKFSFNEVRKTGLKYLLCSLTVLFLQWTVRFTVLILLLKALDIEFKVFQVYLQQWIVYLTMIFIPTPGASGGAEATFYLLFEKQLPKEFLPLIITTWRFFMYYMMLFLAIFVVQFVKFPEKKTDNN